MAKVKEMIEIGEDEKCKLLHIFLGIPMGILSAFISNKLAVLVSLLALLAFGHVLQRYYKNKDFKWWVANGIYSFIVSWLFVWIFTYNLI